MATMTIRNLDPVVLESLKRRASESGRSAEAEVREILTQAVAPRPESGTEFVRRIRSYFTELPADGLPFSRDASPARAVMFEE